MLDAGKFFLRKQQRSTGVSEKELIKIAVKSMGLDELAPFKPEERIIEYLLKDPSDSKLVSMTLADFAASKRPVKARYLGRSISICWRIGYFTGNHGCQPFFTQKRMG